MKEQITKEPFTPSQRKFALLILSEVCGGPIQTDEVTFVKRRRRGGQALHAYFEISQIEVEMKWSYFERRLKLEQRKRRDNQFFGFVELFSRILPLKVRTEAFEPAYHDLKGDFLRARRRHKSVWARRWIAFCFGTHALLAVAQCFWGMCNDTVRRAFLSSLSHIFKWLLG